MHCTARSTSVNMSPSCIDRVTYQCCACQRLCIPSFQASLCLLPVATPMVPAHVQILCQPRISPEPLNTTKPSTAASHQHLQSGLLNLNQSCSTVTELESGFAASSFTFASLPEGAMQQVGSHAAAAEPAEAMSTSLLLAQQSLMYPVFCPPAPQTMKMNAAQRQVSNSRVDSRRGS
jgi:hypothetical protein